MKEAFGGVMNLMFIAVFLIIIMGLLGLVVTYSKAFKMKNIAISTIEEYDGLGCGAKRGISNPNTACLNKIRTEAGELGYNPVVGKCSNGFKKGPKLDGATVPLYCYKISSTGSKKIVYTIELNVDINFPLMSDIFGMSVFKVTGDTRIISTS